MLLTKVFDILSWIFNYFFFSLFLFCSLQLSDSIPMFDDVGDDILRRGEACHRMNLFSYNSYSPCPLATCYDQLSFVD